MVQDFTAGAEGDEGQPRPDHRRRSNEIAAYYQQLLADQRIELHDADRRAGAVQHVGAASVTADTPGTPPAGERIGRANAGCIPHPVSATRTLRLRPPRPCERSSRR
jgi:hypothetical protein